MNQVYRNYEKFFTYPETADQMARLLRPQSGETILEPSAGNGALIKAVKRLCNDCIITAIELDQRWENELTEIADLVHIGDFLKNNDYSKYDKLIANPPFGNDTDLKQHFWKIISAVKKRGKIVMIVPEDFYTEIKHEFLSLKNWSKNSDGTTTEIKIIYFNNP